MKVPIKVKEATKMLWEVIRSLTPIYYNQWDSIEILKLQTKARAILYYRLCPCFCIPDLASTDIPETIKDIMNSNQLWTGDSEFMEIFNVLVNFQVVSLDDLENEFIELCPDPDSFSRYLTILIKPIFSNLPNYEESIDSCIEYITWQETDGKMTSDEARVLRTNVYIISDLVGVVFENICRVYNQFLQREQVSLQQKICNKQNIVPKEITVDGNINFHSGDTENNLTTIFEKLKDDNYFDANSDLQTWLYICGDTTKKRIGKKLNWIKQQQLLAYLVDSLFGDTDGQKMWSITEKVFTIKGKKPNTNTMKNTISLIKNKWKGRPKSFNDLDEILKL